MNKRYGFTLIELLVVIAMISVLMGILMSALRSVRKQASGSVCLSNQHQLVLAWIMYAQENDDKLVGGAVLSRPPINGCGQYTDNVDCP